MEFDSRTKRFSYFNWNWEATFLPAGSGFMWRSRLQCVPPTPGRSLVLTPNWATNLKRKKKSWEMGKQVFQWLKVKIIPWIFCNSYPVSFPLFLAPAWLLGRAVCSKSPKKPPLLPRYSQPLLWKVLAPERSGRMSRHRTTQHLTLPQHYQYMKDSPSKGYLNWFSYLNWDWDATFLLAETAEAQKWCHQALNDVIKEGMTKNMWCY